MYYSLGFSPMRAAKLMVSIFVVLSLFIPTLAGAGCLTGDCENGKGIMTFPDGTEYSGEFKDGTPHGMGTFTYAEGKTLDTAAPYTDDQGRTWNTGLPMGKHYVGEVKDGKRNGQGTLTYYSGAKYTGAFVNDMLSGKGVMINPGGIVYTGNFIEGQPSGKGHATFPDGRIYEGDVVKNQMTGIGTMTYPDGRIEKGEWKNGKLIKDIK